MTMDPLIDLTLRVALAAVLVWAAAHKLRDLPAFAVVVEAYQILPRGLGRWLAPALATVELTLAALLLWPPARVVASSATSVLFVTYSLAIRINLRRGRRDVDCGCFGPARRRPLSEWLLLRNTFLVAAALVVGLPVEPRSLGPLDAFAGLAAVAALAMLWTAADQLLAQWPGLRALRRAA